MGFFGKIKENFKHGGVKVAMQAAQSVSKQNPNLPVAIIITNGPGGPQTIKKVKLYVTATERSNNVITVGDTNNMNNNVQTYTIAEVDNNEQFVLQAGETKTVNMTIVVGGPSVPGQATGVLGGLEKVMGAFGNFSFDLHASADVEGIALDPHARQDLQILQ